MNSRQQLLKLSVQMMNLQQKETNSQIMQALEWSLSEIGRLDEFERELFMQMLDDMAQGYVEARDSLDKFLVKLKQAYTEVPARQDTEEGGN